MKGMIPMPQTNTRKNSRSRPVKGRTGSARKNIVFAAVIAVMLILAAVLVALLRNDNTPDEALQAGSANNLIIVEGDDAPSYRRLGQLAEVDGYTLTSSSDPDDENILYYSYIPAADGLLDQVLIDAGAFSATEYIDSLYADYSEQGDYEVSYPQASEVNGRNVYYMVCRAAGTDSIQIITASVAVGGRSVVMTAIYDSDSPAEYVEDAAMFDALLPFLNALSCETE